MKLEFSWTWILVILFLSLGVMSILGGFISKTRKGRTAAKEEKKRIEEENRRIEEDVKKAREEYMRQFISVRPLRDKMRRWSADEREKRSKENMKKRKNIKSVLSPPI